MLLRVTNRCYGACSHCMIDASGPEGAHMDESTFTKALRFIKRTMAPVVLVSGGEPFEHPGIFEMLSKLKDTNSVILVASNGHFILDEEKTEKVRESGVPVQVSCDPRFYKLVLRASQFPDEQFFFEDRVEHIFPCRRTQGSGLTPSRHTPACFNIRSAVRSMGFLFGTVALAVRALPSVCCPSISVDGTVRAGEADTCYQIGTVDSTVSELEAALGTMSCGRCGLGIALPNEYLKAVGGRI